jgi:hypothetical protein
VKTQIPKSSNVSKFGSGRYAWLKSIKVVRSLIDNSGEGSTFWVSRARLAELMKAVLYLTWCRGKAGNISGEYEGEEKHDQYNRECLWVGVEEQLQVWHLRIDSLVERAYAEEHGQEGHYTEADVEEERIPHDAWHDEGCILDFFADVDDTITALAMLLAEGWLSEWALTRLQYSTDTVLTLHAAPRFPQPPLSSKERKTLEALFLGAMTHTGIMTTRNPRRWPTSDIVSIIGSTGAPQVLKKMVITMTAIPIRVYFQFWKTKSKLYTSTMAWMSVAQTKHEDAVDANQPKVLIHPAE